MRFYTCMVGSVKEYIMMKRMIKNKKIFLGFILVIETVGVTLFYLYGYHWLKSLRYLCLMFFLTILGFIDCEKRIIPNRILAVMFLVRAVLLTGEIILFPSYWKELVISAVAGLGIGFLVFLLAYVLSRRNLGLGDVKLSAVLGWYLGASLIWWDLIVCLFLSAAYSCIQLFRKKVKLKDSIPLAPFISFGTILVLLIGF